MAKRFELTRHDLGMAQRIRTFRKKYIANSVDDAESLLGIGKSTISRMENGKYPISPKILKLLQNKYKLNLDWLFDNEGPMQIDTKSTPKITDIGTLKDDISKHTAEIKILNKNLTALWKMVEDQGRIIEDLRDQLHRK